VYEQVNSKPGSKRSSFPKRLAFDQLAVEQNKGRVQRDSLRPNEQRDFAFRRMILSIPPGKVSTYGGIAAAAG
jgi:methylated-DNA-protein-cysteine methyltransferase related protein